MNLLTEKKNKVVRRGLNYPKLLYFLLLFIIKEDLRTSVVVRNLDSNTVCLNFTMILMVFLRV